MPNDNNDDKLGSKFFNASKFGSEYHTDPAGTPGGTPPKFPLFYVDGSDALANQGFTIGFEHVPSGKTVYLKAFMTTFNETYSPDWAEETVYGRMDPIYLFKNTTRVITLGLKVPAASTSEAFENLSKTQRLVQFLYPSYSDVNSGTTISQSPLIRLKVMNLIESQSQPGDRFNVDMAAERASALDPTRVAAGRDAPEGDWKGVRYNEITKVLGGADASRGLLGVLKNLTITHNTETDVGVFEYNNGAILPKLLEINFDFAAIHEHPLGWQVEGEGEASSLNFKKGAFPYGLDAEGSGARSPATIQMLIEARAQAWTAEKERQRECNTTMKLAEQARSNAQARYSGLLGARRLGKDQEAAGDASAYVQSTVEGARLNELDENNGEIDIACGDINPEALGIE